MIPLTLTALKLMDGQPVWWRRTRPHSQAECTLCIIIFDDEPAFITHNRTDDWAAKILSYTELKRMGYTPYKSDPTRQRAERTIKIFVSTPMKGRTEEKIRDRQRLAAAKASRTLLNDGYIEEDDRVEVIENHIGNKMEPLEYLAANFGMMAKADVVVFDDGYSKERGCLCEEFAAQNYGFFCLYVGREDKDE